ncbi:MAG: hypothetical protein M5U28_15560 [Sandaracinaceae bacterium]|nr:hypothetical protein [Sandaracinaceae bacterium]
MAIESEIPRRESPDGYRAAHIDDVFLVVWERVRPETIPQLVASARRAAQVSRERLIYVAVIPDGAPTPDEAGRRALDEATSALLEVCTSMHCVIEGTGFKKSMLRGVAASIFMVSGKRGKMHVHDNLLDALRNAPGLGPGQPSAIVAEAHKRGLLA